MERTRTASTDEPVSSGIPPSFDLLPVGLAHFALDGRFLLVNRRLCEILGYRREDLLQKTFQEVSLADDLAGCISRNEQLVAGVIPRYVYEKRFVSGGDDIVWTRVTVSASRDANGRVEFFVGIAEDITMQREAEERRRVAEERLHLALRAADVGTFRWDLVRDVLEADETLQRLFGLRPEEATSTKAFLSRIHPDDRPRLEEAAAQSAKGAEIDEEFRISLPDGTVRWVRDRGRTFLAEDGSPLCVTGACVDVTSRRVLDDGLRTERERFHTLANSIPQLAWMCDASGARTWFNERWYEYTGTTFEEVAGHGWRKVHHPDHVERVVTGQRECFASGRNWDDRFPLRAKDGTYRWFLSRAVPLRGADGSIRGWLGTNTDITVLTEAEQGRERAIRARDEAIAILSHDLRNPLQSIVLAGSPPAAPLDAEATRRRFGIITRSAAMMDRLIADLLDVSQIEAGTLAVRRREVDVSALLSEISELFAPPAESSGVRLTIEAVSGPLRVQGDHDRLRQVLSNLVGNALKFTREGGTVALTARPDTGSVTFRVQDAGCGIPKDRLPHVFDRFWKVDRASRSGAGLGLAIAKGIVDAHGGRIWIESTESVGTTVSFVLPASPA